MQHVVCLQAGAEETIATETPEIDYGTAGASTDREYRRRLAKDDARRKERFGRFAGVVHAWTGDRQSTTAWSRGADGEVKVGNALSSVAGVTVLHDRSVPGRKLVNIDLIAIAPAGVFVIDAKNHGGTVRIVDKGSFFRSDKRLYVGGRDRSRLAADMAWQVEAVKSALAAAGVDPLPRITPVLCFASANWPWLFPPDEYQGVRLEGLNSLTKLVVAGHGAPPLEVDRITKILATMLRAK
jgi:hypothetical protein